MSGTGAGRLPGSVALVTGTGGSESIGRAIALRLAREGCMVGVLDIDAGGAARVAVEIEERGGQALALPCDITLLPECEAAAARLAERTEGRIDILVNNAAALTGRRSGMARGAVDEWEVEDWDHMLDVNLRGMWFCVRAVLPYMRAAGYGKIINISSSTFWEGHPYAVPYVASKGGVIGLTRTLARELGPQGIRVNALAPGLTRTDAAEAGGMDEAFAAVLRAQCLGQRNEEPDDLAGPAYFLASPDSDFMTGQTLLVDGGVDHN